MSTKPRVHQQLHKYLAFEAPFHKMSQFFFQVCKKDTENRVSSRFLLCEEEEKPGIEHKSTFTFLWGAVPWGSYSTTAISTTKRFFLLFYSSFSSPHSRKDIPFGIEDYELKKRRRCKERRRVLHRRKPTIFNLLPPEKAVWKTKISWLE